MVSATSSYRRRVWNVLLVVFVLVLWYNTVYSEVMCARLYISVSITKNVTGWMTTEFWLVVKLQSYKRCRVLCNDELLIMTLSLRILLFVNFHIVRVISLLKCTSLLISKSALSTTEPERINGIDVTMTGLVIEWNWESYKLKYCFRLNPTKISVFRNFT